jgi:hypothetical protein
VFVFTVTNVPRKAPYWANLARKALFFFLALRGYRAKLLTTGLNRRAPKGRPNWRSTGIRMTGVGSSF